MAISKILHMKDSGNSFHARHLKRALDYVMNPEKTQGGRLVGAINCQADMAFEQMIDTKKQFGKTDKRQGYHIILSFKEDEVEPDRAFEITQKFVAEYLGDAYEAVFVVHDNTDHVHSHIVFNSVSFVDGKKYRYEKGDWAKYIQPITNKLCQEYGLSIIDVEDGSKEKQHENYKDVELRDDVLAYTTEPLKEAVTIAGEPVAILYAASSAKDTDWVVRITDLDQAGNSIRMCDGIVRAKFRKSFIEPKLLLPGEIVRYEIPMTWISNRFEVGHRIRVEVASGADNSIFCNTNTGLPIVDDVDKVVAEQTVYSGGDHCSRVILPIIE